MNFKFSKNKIFYIYIFTFCIILIASFISYIDSLNNKFYDLKLKICGKYRSDKYNIKEKIITVSIDDSAVSQIGYPSPVLHAKMIKKLKKIGAKIILYDFIFRGNISPELIDATKSAGNVYWPVTFDLTIDEKKAFKINQYPFDLQEIIKKNSLRVKNSSTQLWRTTMGLTSNENLMNASKSVGHISTNNDENEKNNIFRKTALLINIDGNFFPNINLLIACDYFGVPKEKIIINPGNNIILPNAKFPDGSVQDIEIPVNNQCEMFINYIKPWEVNEHGYLEPFWFTTVLNFEGKLERELELEQRLKDKICLVGNASSINKDVHSIPIDTNYPGIGINSHILYTILSGNFIREISVFYSFLILTIYILPLAYIANKVHENIVIILTFSSALIYIVFSYSFFIFNGTNFNDFIPISFFILAGITNLIFHFIIRDIEIKKLLSKLTILDKELNVKNIYLNDIQNKLSLLINSNADATEKINELELISKTEKNKIREIENERNNLQKKIIEISDKRVEPTVSMLPGNSKETQELINECCSLGIITQNSKMLELFKTVKRISKSDFPILLLGETGTGKEIFAGAIHNISNRKNLLVKINIPAIPDNMLESEMFGVIANYPGFHNKEELVGKFELADEGTIFLDEIGDMKLALQAKLLRVLQEKTIDKLGGRKTIKINARIITATNKNLEEKIKKNEFREDLFYRLNGSSIRIPSLRERKDDIPVLVKYFISKSNFSNKEVSKSAMKKLISYSWPGNVRELENVINFAVLSENSIIQAEDIQIAGKNEITNDVANFNVIEDEAFWKIIENNNFEIKATADMLDKKELSVSSRFKGICFYKLSENNWDIEKTINKITNNPIHKKLLKERLNEYYQNVITTIKDYKDEESAKKDCPRKFKNLHKKYHKFIEEIIDQYFAKL